VQSGTRRQNDRSGAPHTRCWPTGPGARTPGLCAFSLTSCITQRDSATGAQRTGQPYPLVPRRLGTAPDSSTDVHGRPAVSRNLGLLDGSGLASASRPGSPRVGRHPAGSPAIPEPVLEPGGLRAPRPGSRSTPTPRPQSVPPPRGRSPCGRHDGRGRQRITAIREDPVGGYERALCRCALMGVLVPPVVSISDRATSAVSRRTLGGVSLVSQAGLPLLRLCRFSMPRVGP
jgi:hypothetical protein